MSDAPTLEEVITDAITHRLAEVHTAIPCRVEAYNATAQTVDCKPMLKRRVPTEDGPGPLESLPVLPDVPVAFPRGGGFFMSFPLAKGDFVFVVFAERSIGEWRGKGAEVDPVDTRMHPLDGAVAIPAVYPQDDAIDSPSTSVVEIGGANSAVRLEVHTDKIVVGGSSDAAALASKVDALEAAFNTHIHTTTATIQATTTPGVISAPTIGSRSNQAPFASARIKVDS